MHVTKTSPTSFEFNLGVIHHSEQAEPVTLLEELHWNYWFINEVLYSPSFCHYDFICFYNNTASYLSISKRSLQLLHSSLLFLVQLQLLPCFIKGNSTSFQLAAFLRQFLTCHRKVDANLFKKM